MEVRRVDAEGPVKWVLSGKMDEDSVMEMESLILNSQDLGAHVVIDMTGLTDLPNIGASAIDHISKEMENYGGEVKIVGAGPLLSKKLLSVEL